MSKLPEAMTVEVTKKETLFLSFSGLILVYVIASQKNRCKMIKALALLLVFVGAAGFVTGLLGVFGTDLISISPWILTILGFFFFLSGYGLLRKDLDEV